MPDKNDKLKGELSRKFENLCVSVRRVESGGLEIPNSLTDVLNSAKSQYDKAVEKFSNGNKEEALGEMQEAVNSADSVSNEAEWLYFMDCYQKACEVRASFKGHEDLAYKYMPNYVFYSCNFREITNLVGDYKSSGKKPHRVDIYNNRCRLQEFLEEFRAHEEELVAAIKKAERASQLEEKTFQLEKETVWLKKFQIGASIVAALVGGGLGWLLTHFFGK